MKRFTAIIAVFLMAVAVPAVASTLGYDNGPPSIGAIPAPAYSISGVVGVGPTWVSDTFTLSQSEVLASAQVALWFNTGASLTSLDYCISNTADCSAPLESGVVALGNPTLVGTSSGFTLDQFGFSLVGNLYSAGTYWLQLTGATVNAGSVYWDVNGGVGCTGDDGLGTGCPSGTRFSLAETPIATQGSFVNNNSESFQILATPEPGSIILIGTGLLALGMFGRRVRANLGKN